ncbi:MAG TPA: PilZ domain-containing protein [Myxococcota bacterium]
MSDQKRRGAERVRVNREFDTMDEFIAEYVSDISQSGVFIRSDDPLPAGTKVELRFTIIDEDMEIIEGIGEVTRLVRPGGGPQSGMGVAFVELTPSSQALVDRVLGRRQRA